MNLLKAVLFVLIAANTTFAAGRDDRAAAFAKGPLSFASSGSAKWGLFSKSRSSEYTLSPVMEWGKLSKVRVEVKGKKEPGLLDVEEDGRFGTDETDLVNIANVGSVLPDARKLLLEGKTVEVESRVEIGGKLVSVRVTHVRAGTPVGDWLVKVRSRTKSPDGRLDLVTDTILAPDGLPLQSETRGDYHQGAYSLRISSKLERK